MQHVKQNLTAKPKQDTTTRAMFELRTTTLTSCAKNTCAASEEPPHTRDAQKSGAEQQMQIMERKEAKKNSSLAPTRQPAPCERISKQQQQDRTQSTVTRQKESSARQRRHNRALSTEKYTATMLRSSYDYRQTLHLQQTEMQYL